jgi:hypothetical protein
MEIPLYQRGGSIVAWAIVDASYYRQASKFRWHRTAQGYAARRDYSQGRPGTMVLMHRDVLGLKKGDPRQGDHKNRNKLDCRKRNLRVVNPGHNGHNIMRRGNFTSQFRGVSWDKKTNKWVATVHAAGKKHVAGYFTDENLAARAVRNLRRELLSHALD